MADNLLDKASILLTPTAYDDGSMLSIKPENGDGDFDFQRNSAATRVNAQGLVENVQIISSELVSNGNFSQIGTEEVLNGNFSQQGSELVTNGDFEDGENDWSFGGDWTLVNGTAEISTSTHSFLRADGSQLPLAVKNYKLQYEVISTNGSNFRLSGGSSAFGTVTLDSATIGVKTFYLQSNGTQSYLQFSQNSFIGSITNISVKEVGQNWTLGSGWSIGEDKVIATDVNNVFLEQSNILTIGKSYKITYTILDYVSGSVRFRANLVNGATNSTNGTYTDYIVSAGTKFSLQGLSNFNGSITNISVKEVGQDWNLGTGWSIGENKAISDATQGYIIQTNVGGVGVTATYKVQWTQNITAGTRLRFFGRNYNDSGGVTILSITRDDGLNIGGGNCVGSGTFTAYLSSTNGYSFKILAETGVEADITNISVKEITDDTNIPRINYEGFSYQDTLGSELVVNGDFATNSNWNGSETIANGQLTKTNNGLVYQGTLDVSVEDYKVVVDVDTVGSSLTIYLGGVQQSLSEGINTIDMQSGGSNSFVGFNNGDGSVINSISVKKVTGQEVVPDSGCGSWLLEPQSTNLITYSEDFSQWALAGSATINANQTLSPDGTQNAYLFNSLQASSRVQVNMNSLTGVYAQSIYLKYAGDDVLVRFRRDQSNDDFTLNVNSSGITAGTIDSGVIEYKIEDVGNGWYRVWNTQNNLGWYQIYIDATGNGGSVYAWGAQLEQQSYATSYIPTNGATNTRLQDIANNSGNSSLINSAEGVLYAEIKRDTLANTFHLISLNNASSNSDANSVTIGVNGGEKFFVRVKSPNGSYTSQGIPMSIGDFHKVAIRYEQGNIGLFIDGTKEDTFTGAWLFTLPLDNLSFDYNGDGTLPFYGKTKALVVYKEALTDASLKSLTYPNPVATTFDLDFDTIAEQFTFTRGSEATFVNAQGLIESTASNDAPRIDYSTGEEAFLLEPQSTNLVVNSNDSFVINSGNILYNNAISPDGTQNAYRFESSGTSGAFVRTANVAFSTTSSFSVFLKYGNNQWYQIINSSATGFYANVDIQNGVFGTSGSQTENLLIKDYGNGWYRVSGTFTNASGNGTLRVYASSSGSSSWAVASASIGSYNYGYGFQVENQSYSTSYIPTSGAIATRNQELCVDATPVINSEEGTLYAEVSALADDGTTRIISLSEDGNLNNRINMFYTSGSNKMKFVVKVNGSNVFDDTITLSNILDYNKVALRYGANNFAIYINGVKESEQLSGSTYPSNTLDKLNFDQGSGNYEFFGNTKDLKYYPKALADVQLEDLTTI